MRNMREYVIYNAQIYTLDEQEKIAQDMLIRRGRIAAIGSMEEVFLIAHRNAHKLNWNNKTIIPGFINKDSQLIERCFYKLDFYRNMSQNNQKVSVSPWQILRTFYFVSLELLKKGYTTNCVYINKISHLQMLFWMNRWTLLRSDIVVYPNISIAASVVPKQNPYFNTYRKNVRIGGCYMGFTHHQPQVGIKQREKKYKVNWTQKQIQKCLQNSWQVKGRFYKKEDVSHFLKEYEKATHAFPENMKLRPEWIKPNIEKRQIIKQIEEKRGLDLLIKHTREATYQIFEEKEKGSLDVGKKADFIVLNKNPFLKKEIGKKKNTLRILAVYKNGKRF